VSFSFIVIISHQCKDSSNKDEAATVPHNIIEVACDFVWAALGNRGVELNQWDAHISIFIHNCISFAANVITLGNDIFYRTHKDRYSGFSGPHVGCNGLALSPYG
jgi:hypothetical protein